MYRRSTVIAIWSLLAAGAVYLFMFEPGKIWFLPDLPVPIFNWSSLVPVAELRALCTRFFTATSSTAFTLNPLFLIAIPFMLFAFLRYSVIVMRGGVPRPNALPAPYIYAIFFIVVSFLDLSQHAVLSVCLVSFRLQEVSCA